LAFFYPALFVLLWSTGFIGGKLGLPHAEPFTFLSLRFVLVIALLVPLSIAMKARWPRTRREWVHIAVAGLMLQLGYLSGCFSAIHAGMPAGVIALVLGLQPILTALAAAPLLGEQVTSRQWLGLVLGFGGVVLVVWEKLGLGELGAASIAWSMVSLLSITFGTIYQKRFCPRFDLRTGAIIQFTASLLVAAPVALLAESGTVRWTGEFVFALGWLVLVLSIGAISLLYHLIEHGEATRVTSLFYLTPPVTAAMAWALFGETLGVPALLGMIIAVTGVALAVRKPA
jgi:drug/metabolite transporter (DMT)-like permease